MIKETRYFTMIVGNRAFVNEVKLSEAEAATVANYLNSGSSERIDGGVCWFLRDKVMPKKRGERWLKYLRSLFRRR